MTSDTVYTNLFVETISSNACVLNNVLNGSTELNKFKKKSRSDTESCKEACLFRIN